MTALALVYEFETPKSAKFADLDLVVCTRAVTTDEGEEVPAGTRGTIVGIWNKGSAYEVEFEDGLATVEATALSAA